MKIEIVSVSTSGKDLKVTFPRTDWVQTSEGIRAARVLKIYGAHQVRARGAEALVIGAAGESCINTTQACQREMNHWANEKMAFRFIPTVKFEGREFSSVRAMRNALGLARVDAELEVVASLPVLQRDRDVLAQNGYADAFADDARPSVQGLDFRMRVSTAVDPWEVLDLLKTDIVRLIK